MIVVLTGDNSYAIRQELAGIAQPFISQHGEAGYERRDGSELAVAELPTLLGGVNLFSPRKLVVIREPAAQKTIWEVLPDHLEGLGDETRVVLVQSQLDKRTRTYKWLAAHAELRTCNMLQGAPLLAWLRKYAAEKGASLSTEVARHLVERAGAEQGILAAEVDKLALLGGSITMEVVDTYTEATPQAAVFDVFERVLEGRAAEVHHLLQDLHATEDPYRFMGLLTSQVYGLGAAALARRAGISADTAARELGVHPFAFKRHMTYATRLNVNQIGDIVGEIQRADACLKSTGAEPWTIIDSCLKRLAQSMAQEPLRGS